MPPPPLRAEPPEADYADGEVELILADARARAHRLIEDSVVRAQELLEERHGGDWQALERVRGSVGDLRDEIHALYERLDSIETLLRERPLPPPERTANGDAAPETVAGASLTPPWATSEEPPLPEPPLDEPPPQGGQPPDEPPPPPMPPPFEAPEASSEQSQASVETVEAVARPYANGTAGNGIRFAPEDGSVLLRVTPVAGFQGLMRVQDALVRVVGIREAGVEAYAQGEARLRLRLDAPLAPSRLASEIGELLGVAARVAGASEQDRSLQLALE